MTVRPCTNILLCIKFTKLNGAKILQYVDYIHTIHTIWASLHVVHDFGQCLDRPRMGQCGLLDLLQMHVCYVLSLFTTVGLNYVRVHGPWNLRSQTPLKAMMRELVNETGITPLSCLGSFTNYEPYLVLVLFIVTQWISIWEFLLCFVRV